MHVYAVTLTSSSLGVVIRFSSTALSNSSIFADMADRFNDGNLGEEEISSTSMSSKGFSPSGFSSNYKEIKKSIILCKGLQNQKNSSPI